MTYTPEQLTVIEQMAAIYMKPSEIAVSLDIPVVEFKQDIALAGSLAHNAYQKGKISQKVQIRKQTALLARVGSPLALEMSERALLDMEDDE